MEIGEGTLPRDVILFLLYSFPMVFSEDYGGPRRDLNPDDWLEINQKAGCRKPSLRLSSPMVSSHDECGCGSSAMNSDLASSLILILKSINMELGLRNTLSFDDS